MPVFSGRIAAGIDELYGKPRGRIELPVVVPINLKHDSKAVRVRFVVRIVQTGREGTADATLE